MDITSVKPNESILSIVHPATGKNLGIVISLLSISDPKMKKIKRQIQDRALQLQRKGKGFDSAQLDENENVLLFNAMTGWTWGTPTDDEGKEIPGETPALFHGETPAFTKENVFKVFNELEWFRDQIDEKVSDTKSFFQASN